MPHIHAITTAENNFAKSLLRGYKEKICRQLATVCGYNVGEIALIPRLLTDEEVELSENILPLEFVIDSGKSYNWTEESSKTLAGLIIQNCSGFERIHFGVWGRGMSNNGFYEHKPVA